ncbi:MAG: molecular chaperone HtpG [Alphaproteobacteria bacterium]|nr:molecular chaperone HtpG [Alphaproteobacteria bacterium]
MAVEAKPAETAPETHEFQAEVGRLLDIVANALYSEREIFLRELISNAADACDRLRYQALSDAALIEGDPDFAITLSADAEAKTLTVSDNGSGMSRDELLGNLGTIARSGTSNFLNQLSGDDKKDLSLIGQFGVGFYSAFMVADSVAVTSRKAGADEAFTWVSDGKGAFTVEPGARDGRGTTIVLHLKEDAAEFLTEARLSQIVKTYSDHIAFPIRITGENPEDGDAVYPKQLNSAAALWTRSKSDVTEDQYKEFYHHVSHGFDDPWATLHFRAEGVIEYAGLIYIPTQRPFDLFHPDRQSKLKLYVKRVFITDECDELVPSWLRFLRGVVDSEDLPLNVSREMLQNNPVVSKIQSGLVKRVLGELAKRAEKDADNYAEFWDAFGAVLKEGVYESFENRDALMKLMRFKSTTREGWLSLADYIEAMKDGQDAIYYISGDSAEALAKSPQLEGFAAKGVEVLFMTDPVDEFWLSNAPDFEGKSFKSVTRGGADLSNVKADEKEAAEDSSKDEDKTDDASVSALITALKESLGEAVADVRKSDRLTASPCCLVVEDGAMDMHLERILKQHNQLNGAAAPRILEINADHALIKALAANATGDISDAAHLLLDQARIMEGETPADPSTFVQRMAAVMTKAMG